MTVMADDFRDLTGSEFERADLSGSRFSSVILNRATSCTPTFGR